MALSITIRGDGFARMSEAVKVLGEKRAKAAYRKAVNQAGRDTKTPTGQALAKQTGLKPNVTRRALRPTQASGDSLTYKLDGKGGDIALKYFAARETRKGVSAAPWSKRSVFDSTFMKAGWWKSGRVTKSNWNGHVFERWGGKTNSGMDRFRRVKSGVYLPVEMVKGITAKTFEDIGIKRLEHQVQRHLKLATKGVLS